LPISRRFFFVSRYSITDVREITVSERMFGAGVAASMAPRRATPAAISVRVRIAALAGAAKHSPRESNRDSSAT